MSTMQLVEVPDWEAFRSQEPEEVAQVLRGLLVHLDNIEERAFAIRGEAMLLIEERNLFRFFLDEQIGEYYQSFDRWLKDTLPRSWGYCRDALRTRKELKEMPYKDFVGIRRCNLETIKKLSPKVRRDRKVIESAKTLPNKDFIAETAANHPDQHLSLKSKLEEAISMAMAIEGCSRKEAEEIVGEAYIAENAVAYEHLEVNA